MIARPPGPIILCADDFAISDGVSRGIEELAQARRLSATSALVTLPTWNEHAPRLGRLRPLLAIGLHLNLTLADPLGPMPSLAPQGRLPDLTTLLRRALMWRLDQAEIAAEFERQLTRFEQAAGVAPDFIDGHQHVHVLPIVRRALLDVLQRRFPAGDPRRGSLLVRDPTDAMLSMLQRLSSAQKALVIAGLAAGFGRGMRRAGFTTNAGFAGVSAFDVAVPFADELAEFFRAPGRRHLVMCHPGYPDADLARLDPHTQRRRQELDAIMAEPRLDATIWHVQRSGDAETPVWPGSVQDRVVAARQDRPA